MIQHQNKLAAEFYEQDNGQMRTLSSADQILTLVNDDPECKKMLLKALLADNAEKTRCEQKCEQTTENVRGRMI